MLIAPIQKSGVHAADFDDAVVCFMSDQSSRYGYRTTPEILRFVKENEDLGKNLCTAAHLIHGSSEGRLFLAVIVLVMVFC